MAWGTRYTDENYLIMKSACADFMGTEDTLYFLYDGDKFVAITETMDQIEIALPDVESPAVYEVCGKHSERIF